MAAFDENRHLLLLRQPAPPSKLKGKTRHELSCGSCGAPLHELKMLPDETPHSDRRTGPALKDAPSPRILPRYTAQPQIAIRAGKHKGRKRYLRTHADEGLRRRTLFDVVEDVFDIFD